MKDPVREKQQREQKVKARIAKFEEEKEFEDVLGLLDPMEFDAIQVSAQQEEQAGGQYHAGDGGFGREILLQAHAWGLRSETVIRTAMC